MNETPKLISVGSAVPNPSRPYSQEEIFGILGYPSRFRRLFTESAIDHRYFALPLGQAREYTWQQMCEEYERAALKLSKETAIACLDERPASSIACLAFTSCTGFHVPAMTYLIAKDLIMSPQVEHISIVGDGGCAGALPALRQAYNFTRITGKMSLALSCEICSCCYYPEPIGEPDPRGRWQLLRSNAIFGDGASAVLVGYDDSPEHPFIIGSISYSDTGHLDALGLEWREGRLSCVLSDQVPELAPGVIEACVKPLLEQHRLSVRDVKWLFCHPGGKRVLDNVQKALGFSDKQMFLSREGLRLFGNCSSAGVGLLGSLLKKQEISSGDWGLIATVGSGMSAQAMLLRWP